MNVFNDQAEFMRACGQTVGEDNPEQFALYMKLVAEEMAELQEAIAKNDRVETFDAILDLIVVLIGAGHSKGLPMPEGWDQVTISNMRKVNPETGRVERREDGKILKPAGWRPPRLAQLLEIQHG